MMVVLDPFMNSPPLGEPGGGLVDVFYFFASSLRAWQTKTRCWMKKDRYIP